MAKAKGINLKLRERLRWTVQHPGVGVLLRGLSSEILKGTYFRVLRDSLGAYIETDD